jgi:hypothetical protein
MGKTRGSNIVPEPIPDGSDIRRISEPAGKIAIPTHCGSVCIELASMNGPDAGT